MKKQYNEQTFVFFIVVIPVIAFIIYLASLPKPIYIDRCSPVVDIGACGWFSCGVKLQDGRFVEVDKPVIGKMICDKI